MLKRYQNSQPLMHYHIRSKKGKSGDEIRCYSVFCFLRKVFNKELGDYSYDNHDARRQMLLGVTVRAALSQSGFVEIDPVSKSLTRSSNFNVQKSWYLSSFYFNLPNTNGKTETVKIRFQNLGRYCRIYGCLVDGIGGTTVHSVLVDKAMLTLFLAVVWADSEQGVVVMRATNRVTDIDPKTEVLKFWRDVKDELVLPLLADVREKVGREPPLCFTGLPDEIKLKILDSVSGVDLASVSCVCSKLRRFVSSSELWKQKYFKQFGGFGCYENDKFSYKELYARAWKNWKGWKNGLRSC